MEHLIVTANDFDTGAVLYQTRDGWGGIISDARLFEDQDTADQAVAGASLIPHRIVGAYAIAVTLKDGVITPVQLREKIRATGPGNYQHFNFHHGNDHHSNFHHGNDHHGKQTDAVTDDSHVSV